MLRSAYSLMGRDLVAATLNVAPTLLDAWMSGSATMPEGKLTLLTDALQKYAKPK
jgi:hypothetical protein